MTESPLLPPGAAGLMAGPDGLMAGPDGPMADPDSPMAGPDGPMAESEATDAELSRMTELALGRDARTVALGRGHSGAATRAAAGFARRFEAAGGTVLGTVTWPESAASWLRPATRFAAADPDLWVMAGPPVGWAQMTRRLLWSTAWRPERTLAFAAIGSRPVIALVGAHNLPGLAGATANGGTWQITDDILQLTSP